MDFTKASTSQLLTIAFHEECPTRFKYQAAFELMTRKDKSTNHEVTRVKGLSAYSGKDYYFRA